MSENKLKFDIVKWFHNSHKKHRGSLFAIRNETNKGAYEKGLGLVKGASDLGHILENGVFCGFEIKLPNTRHDVEHLKDQLEWLKLVNKRGGIGFFIFSLKQFQHAMFGLTEGTQDNAYIISRNSLNFVSKCIEKAEEKGTKTAKLPWKDDYIYRPIK